MRSILFAGVLGLAACVIGPARGDETSLAHQLQAVADHYVETRHEAEKISGVALHVDLRGQHVIDVYSGTDGRDGKPIGAGTLFQIGSNTKHFTAALMLQLEAKGMLNIEQTVGHWLPQYPAWAHVTIRSLLNMTSDIPNYTETVPIARAMSDMHQQFSYDDLIDAVYDKGLPVPSGYFYSNTNNIIAAKIIEAALHRSFKDALAAMLAPLHLKDTFYEDGPYPPSVLRRLPVGIYDNRDCPRYQPQPCTVNDWAPLVGKDVSHMNMSWAGPAGGMISNTRDLATWVRALFEGRVIPQKQLHEMTSVVSTETGRAIPDVSADDPAGFGLDLARAYHASRGGAYWYYQGTTFGFRAIFAYWPQDDLVITTATNSQPPDGEDRLAPMVVEGAFRVLQKDHLIP